MTDDNNDNDKPKQKHEKPILKTRKNFERHAEGNTRIYMSFSKSKIELRKYFFGKT